MRIPPPLLLAATLILTLPGSASERPNVLLIVADDLGFSDLGCYGSEIRTPHLDRLAAEGTRFTQAYNLSVCSLSRAALYTGLYPRQGRGGLLRPGMATLGEVMHAAGYETTLTGKWHLGAESPRRPIDRGFDEFYGVLSGSMNHFDPARPDPEFYRGRTRPFAHNDRRLTKFPPDFYSSDAFSAHAISRIRHAAQAGKPFFVNLCFTAPHFPIQAPAEDIARYRGRYHEGYERLREHRHRRLAELGLIDPAVTRLSAPHQKSGEYQFDYGLTPWNELTPEARAREEALMEAYAGMVDRLDQDVGQVLQVLDELGLAQNTIVFFLSDNGGCAGVPAAKEMPAYLEYNRDIPIGDVRGYEFVGAGWGWAQNAPFRRHKVWTYEGGVCTPLIVRWPGVVVPGSLTHAPTHVVDFMPTLLELVGQQYPAARADAPLPPLEGRSMIPQLRDPAVATRSGPLFWELYGNRAVREGDWKAVWTQTGQHWELYNLAQDRSETVNLADAEPERVATLVATWTRWAEQTESPSLANPRGPVRIGQ
ncbi:MAG: arylsulfatase [Opitutaceae bacterium]|nr:arylsulfatase [Opitutaceae bacterium]